ncbi:hypothetical protein AAT19DRAFT_15617 [Rhodotorula toruloides]|uniref:Uncharacterized protein n=1 Tax=Rhodotorula toruloides TaxID=5286 RepID=A0A2T0A7R4_RHOTO|nr:hypothetical protein AAT19DRAFT_15617 [Rhodotorula toruloides]
MKRTLRDNRRLKAAACWHRLTDAFDGHCVGSDGAARAVLAPGDLCDCPLPSRDNPPRLRAQVDCRVQQAGARPPHLLDPHPRPLRLVPTSHRHARLDKATTFRKSPARAHLARRVRPLHPRLRFALARLDTRLVELLRRALYLQLSTRMSFARMAILPLPRAPLLPPSHLRPLSPPPQPARHDVPRTLRRLRLGNLLATRSGRRDFGYKP